MFILKILLRNAFRHKLRTTLTIIGIAVAITAFGLLRSLVELWYLGAERSSATRLITRNAISLVFPMPISYGDRIRQVPGIKAVSYGNWFGGIYIEEKNFFANYAVEPKTYLDLYPEFILSPDQKSAFIRDRKACIAGRKLANLFGWKIGDTITLRGTIFPGQWEFVLRGIYRGAEKSTEERVLMFQWDYLNETMKHTAPQRADQVGFFLIGVTRPDLAAEVAVAVDGMFKNSLAETLTETERAFNLGFIAMTEAILVAIQFVSYMIIVIIMIVAANTMAMTARERMTEYATLKTLGFGASYIAAIVFGESLVIALTGGVIGVLLTFPGAHWIESELSQYFPAFNVSRLTISMEFLAALVIGTVAAIIPTWRAATIGISEGLRRIG
jgi:putative ABC transport system permease protein